MCARACLREICKEIKCVQRVGGSGEFSATSLFFQGHFFLQLATSPSPLVPALVHTGPNVAALLPVVPGCLGLVCAISVRRWGWNNLPFPFFTLHSHFQATGRDGDRALRLGLGMEGIAAIKRPAEASVSSCSCAAGPTPHQPHHAKAGALPTTPRHSTVPNPHPLVSLSLGTMYSRGIAASSIASSGPTTPSTAAHTTTPKASHQSPAALRPALRPAGRLAMPAPAQAATQNCLSTSLSFRDHAKAAAATVPAPS